MKQRVDFYLLATGQFSGCFPFACQLIEKAYHQGYTLLVYTESADANASLDSLLWTYRNTSFIPHQRTGECTLAVQPMDHKATASLVVNCRLLGTPTQLECQRFLQIIPNHTDLLPLARQHYRFYQQQGYQMTTHQIK